MSPVEEQTGKRVLLIRPRDNMPAFWFPLGLAFIKSNIPSRHTVEILDCALRSIPANSPQFREEIERFNPDVVGVSTLTLTYKEALNVLREIKAFNENIVTVIGGPHPTLYPEKVFGEKPVDYIIRGEGDVAFSNLLDYLEGKIDIKSVPGIVYEENGNIVNNDVWLEWDMDRIKYPDYTAAGLDAYYKKGYRYGGFYGKCAPIWVTRGCPYACKFCSSPLINGKKIRGHSPEWINGLIKHLYDQYGVRQFTIVDDNFTFEIDYAKTFCREIIKLKENNQFPEGIMFTTPNGIRMQRIDDELLQLMKQAGWEGVTVAPESGSKRILKIMQKGLDPSIVPGCVDRIKAVGLKVRAFFIVGYPGETKEDTRDTIKLLRKCKIDAFMVSLFHPIPGTPVYDDLVAQGKISDDFVPDSFSNAIVPKILRRTNTEKYITEGFEDFSLFWFALRENLLLWFRNPRSFIYFIKLNGFFNVIKKLYQLATYK
ncbi:MAG: hypothetical protein A3F16_00775 [Deltaproteobacteria bacterium RIFCSPHIGHO2_12_FULL_43_9]|nr:MAG: hypothetical protein A3F16_00775 [Deltaproteobacteria bacterium RIFCSPHIGHO2_12_FULL_43_9]